MSSVRDDVTVRSFGIIAASIHPPSRVAEFDCRHTGRRFVRAWRLLSAQSCNENYISIFDLHGAEALATHRVRA